MKQKSTLGRFIFSFPVQLLVMQIKKNQLVLMYWVLLFSFVTQSISERFGIPYLFLDPEYLGKVDYVSFFIVGITCGSFIMAFNISSYILNSFRFPFLASLSKPFLKYSLNNFIIPITFLMVYISQLIRFQYLNQFDTPLGIAINISSFLLGVYIIIILTLRYFLFTNKDIYKLFGVQQADLIKITDEEDDDEEDVMTKDKSKENTKPFLRKKWRVDTYLSSPVRLRLVRSTEHYKSYMLHSVFRQNHINAAVVEIIIFGVFIVLGLLRDYEIFQLPAAASVMLFFTMILMLSGVFRYWLKSWANAALIGLFVLLNFLSQFEFINQKNKAVGLDYNPPAREYSAKILETEYSDEHQKKDIISTIQILEKWKSKYNATGIKKPKLVILNVSGGGLRSSYFTFNIIQSIDSITNGQLMEQTRLITGSSGGLIGASYYRQLKYSKKHHIDFTNHRYLENMGKDLLNATAFSFMVSDLFFNLQGYNQDGNRYYKDRGYAFEQQLNKNLEGVLDVKLNYYKKAEENADIPMLVMAPTIVNDGRSLLVSTIGVSYLLKQQNLKTEGLQPIPDGVEFTRFFKNYNPYNTSFVSLLRMNATFPYIMPTTVLPTTPFLEITDAGMRDNYGIINSVRYIFHLKEWIKENTSGVVLIQIRDTNKKYKHRDPESNTILNKITSPLRNITGNFILMQDYVQDDYLRFVTEWLDVPFDYLLFQLPKIEKQISLSWHLTKREKLFLRNAAYTEENLNNLLRVKKLLDYTHTQGPGLASEK
jgi:hypothetical protein